MNLILILLSCGLTHAQYFYHRRQEASFKGHNYPDLQFLDSETASKVEQSKKAFHTTSYRSLFNDTNSLVNELDLQYNALALTPEDNYNIPSYTYSLLQAFYLTFMDTYDQLTSEYSDAQYKSGDNVDQYSVAFNLTVYRMRSQEEEEALDFSGPVRRAFDALKAIISKPVEIVEKHCSATMSDMACLKLHFYPRIILQAFKCPKIWNHLKVFQDLLKLHTSGVSNEINNLESNVKTEASKDIYLRAGPKQSYPVVFVLVMEFLEMNKEGLRESLSAKAKFYSEVKNKLERGLLPCTKVYY